MPKMKDILLVPNYDKKGKTNSKSNVAVICYQKLIKNIKSHCDSLSETEPKLDQNPNPKYYHLAEWKLAIKN